MVTIVMLPTDPPERPPASPRLGLDHFSPLTLDKRQEYMHAVSSFSVLLIVSTSSMDDVDISTLEGPLFGVNYCFSDLCWRYLLWQSWNVDD